MAAFSPHAWNDRPYGATDSGTALNLSWSAQSGTCECLGDIAICETSAAATIVAPGRCGAVNAYSGATGAQLWSIGPFTTDIWFSSLNLSVTA